MNSDKTIGKLFLKRTKISKDKNAIGWSEIDQIKFHSFREYRKIVESLSHAFIKFGLKVGTKVSILSTTCKEWHFCDLALLCLGGVVVPIPPHYGSEEIFRIIEHSDSSILIIENSFQLGKIQYRLKNLKKLELILLIRPISTELKLKIPSSIKVIDYSEFLKNGMIDLDKNNFNFSDHIENLSSQEVATIIYTSGTNGESKGAVFTHKALIAAIDNVKSFAKSSIGPQDRNLIFLPLSHVFGRIGTMLSLIFEIETVFTHPRDKLLDSIGLIKPTILFMTPVILTKIYSQLRHQMDHENYFKKKIFSISYKIASSYFDKIQLDLSPSPNEILKYKLSYKLIFSKIHKLLGGRIRFFISGGSSLESQIYEFFRNMGFTILEGYGLTETFSVGTLNPLTKQIPQTVGIPFGDVQVQFGKDKEILLKTSACFSLYYKNSILTKEAFSDGWFHTGDFGHFNSEGYLHIIGRKKNLSKSPNRIKSSLEENKKS